MRIEKKCDNWKRLWELKKIMIIEKKNVRIEKNCENLKRLWELRKIVIKKIHACNKMNFSSNINEAIRAVLNSKSTKSTKTQPSKSTKTQISEQK